MGCRLIGVGCPVVAEPVGQVRGRVGDGQRPRLLEAYGYADWNLFDGDVSLDLRAGIRRQLQGLGVAAVAEDPRCTISDPTLFSHRRGAPTGRLASVIWIDTPK